MLIDLSICVTDIHKAKPLATANVIISNFPMTHQVNSMLEGKILCFMFSFYDCFHVAFLCIKSQFSEP